MGNEITIFTLKAHCKKCDTDFTYTRSKNLMGAPRSICDDCRAKRRQSDRTAAIWRTVVEERKISAQDVDSQVRQKLVGYLAKNIT